MDVYLVNSNCVALFTSCVINLKTWFPIVSVKRNVHMSKKVWEMNIEEDKEDVFSIAVFSVTSVKVAVQSKVLCDAFIYPHLCPPLGMCVCVCVCGAGTQFFFFSSLSNLKVGMCGEGPVCRK